MERYQLLANVRQTIGITVPGEPALAGIDPYRKLINRQCDDNVIGVEATGPNTAGSYDSCEPLCYASAACRC